MNPRTLLMFLYGVEACVLILLSIPLILGRIAPNRWYGFRVKRTIENPSVWYPANRFAATQLSVLGVLLLITAISLYFIRSLPFTAYALLCLAVTVIGLAIVVFRSFNFLRHLPR